MHYVYGLHQFRHLSWFQCGHSRKRAMRRRGATNPQCQCQHFALKTENNCRKEPYIKEVDAIGRHCWHELSLQAQERRPLSSSIIKRRVDKRALVKTAANQQVSATWVLGMYDSHLFHIKSTSEKSVEREYHESRVRQWDQMIKLWLIWRDQWMASCVRRRVEKENHETGNNETIWERELMYDMIMNERRRL